MKKIFLFATMAIMGLSTVSCSNSDDSNNNNIKGSWVETKIQFLNKDRGVISEISASSNNGECGVDYVTYTDKEYIETYNYQDQDKKCQTETDVYIYKYLGKYLTLTEKERKPEDMEILNWEVREVTGDKLVVLDTDKVESSEVTGEGYPQGTVYIQKVYTRK